MKWEDHSLCCVLLKAFPCSQKGLEFNRMVYSYLHAERLVRERSEAAVKNVSQNSPFLLHINSTTYLSVFYKVHMCTYNIYAHILCTCTRIHNLPNEKESVELLTPQCWGGFLNEIIEQRRQTSSSSSCSLLCSFILKV